MKRWPTALVAASSGVHDEEGTTAIVVGVRDDEVDDDCDGSFYWKRGER